MDKFRIEGGKKLAGEVKISGAKNSALPLLASTILAPGEHIFSNVPYLQDVLTFIKLLEGLGVKVDQSRLKNEHTLMVDSSNISSVKAPYELVKTMRASVLVLGPLVARMRSAEVSLPGGCAIGARPVNLHLKGMELLGAKVTVEHGYIEAKADSLKGTEMTFDISTVTGTENVMMASVLAEGKTILNNSAQEPEVVELAKYLKKMGAKISGEGTDRIEIEGVKELSPSEHTVMPDRIEAGTYMVAGAITRGEIFCKDCEPNHLGALITKLKEAGVYVELLNDGIRVKGTEKLRGVDIKTQPFPGFPTDMQAQMMALLSTAKGAVSVITETIFENRFMHVLELQRMGADIKIEGHSAVVSGVEKLTGASVMATDLRASASLVLAGLVAEGTTEVSRIYHLDRGYEEMEKKLNSVGANIKRVKEG